jgi:hypothetical protein
MYLNKKVNKDIQSHKGAKSYLSLRHGILNMYSKFEVTDFESF